LPLPPPIVSFHPVVPPDCGGTECTVSGEVRWAEGSVPSPGYEALLVPYSKVFARAREASQGLLPLSPTSPPSSYRSLRVKHNTINASEYRSIDSRVFIMDCGCCVTWTNITISIHVFNVNLLLRGVTGKIAQINVQHYFCIL